MARFIPTTGITTVAGASLGTGFGLFRTYPMIDPVIFSSGTLERWLTKNKKTIVSYWLLRLVMNTFTVADVNHIPIWRSLQITGTLLKRIIPLIVTKLTVAFQAPSNPQFILTTHCCLISSYGHPSHNALVCYNGMNYGWVKGGRSVFDHRRRPAVSI